MAGSNPSYTYNTGAGSNGSGWSNTPNVGSSSSGGNSHPPHVYSHVGYGANTNPNPPARSLNEYISPDHKDKARRAINEYYTSYRS